LQVTTGAESRDGARTPIDSTSSLVVGLMRAFAYTTSKLFWSIRFQGTENIPPAGNGGLVVVSNHATYFDPAWISLKLRRPLRFMAWDKAFEWRFIGPLIRRLGAFPVKLRSGPTKSSIVESLRSLENGAALVIFPEGERAFADGSLHSFKSGAVHIAMSAGVPILPVSIKGGNRVWPQGQRYPRFFRHIEITYHKTISPVHPDSSIDLDQYLEELNLQLMRTIESAT
jgi:1-acyl-sn-glycerol-3-phosphate acyltransferase